MSLETPVLAAVVHSSGSEPVTAEVRLDALRPDEVLVDVAASGICHTDLTAIDGGSPFAYPAVFGHEGAGTVVRVGDAVTRVAPGDRVVLTFDSCGGCRRCRDGHPAYCEEFAARNYRGARPDGSATVADRAGEPIRAAWMAQSSWATRAIARETNVVPLGEDLPFALAAPLGCGVLTGAGTVLNVLAPAHEDRLLVVGAGSVGLAGLMAARARGCAAVTVVEPDPARRELALALGATRALAPAELEVRRGSFEHALDTVGSQEALDLAIGALATPGTCATVALRRGGNPVTVSQTALLWGRTLTGVIEGDAVPTEAVPLLVGLWRAGLFPLERLVSPFPFSRLDDAVAAARTGAAVKAVLVMREDGATPAGAAATRGGTAADRVRAIAAAGQGDADELAALWDVLPEARAADLTGLWRGTGIDTGHRIHSTLERSGWFGKNFVDDAHVQPIVCRDPDGTLVADAGLAGGGAWLADCAHRGKVTATMTYDSRPIHDHFVRVDRDTLLGVMAGRAAGDPRIPYYFVLARVEGAPAGPLPERGA
ncbi:alcohol dehydrogenase catalytic domain-containing protein [Demequina sp. SYSU T00192]|uniref:Alcohol dehydrogenase catalytic domain-containing protein n=1 Tax=Demequina litoralis TaxID=3051660 RepID=A0ABT8G5F3_9MICO|nr:alcohol dehydrogenase catalytic domain-containing protein [Demequina sp. SYSU T00192]MDN4474365.1 alcohol dehydrogenase catalytic domain-containing protein [Demequina sp. SYSU T00192]